MVQFTLPDQSRATLPSANAAAVDRLHNGPYPSAQLDFIPERARLFLQPSGNEVGLAQAVSRYLVSRLIALQTFTVSVPASAVHRVEDEAEGKDMDAQSEEVAADVHASTPVRVTPNRFQLAVSLVKGTLRTAYAAVCADVFVAEAERYVSSPAGAYSRLAIAELVLSQIAPCVEEAIFGGALTAFVAHGISLWSPAALAAAKQTPLLHEMHEEEGHAGAREEEGQPEVAETVPPRSIPQGCWSLHRVLVQLSVVAHEMWRVRRATRGTSFTSTPPPADESITTVDASAGPGSQLWCLCQNMNQLLAMLMFMAPEGGALVPFKTEPVSSLACVYTREDAQYLLQMPGPLSPRHAHVAANLVEQSALATMVCAAAKDLVDSLSSLGWMWSNMKSAQLLNALEVCYSPEDILILQLFMQWCADYPELARSIVRDRMNVPALFKVDTLIEARLLSVPPPQLAALSRHHALYPTEDVRQALQRGSLCTRVDLAKGSAQAAGATVDTGDGDMAANAQSARTAGAKADTDAARPPAVVDPLRRELVGLVNAGNTCFVNSVVQLLFHCRPFACELVRTALHTLARRQAASATPAPVLTEPADAAAMPSAQHLQQEDARAEDSATLQLGDGEVSLALAASMQAASKEAITEATSKTASESQVAVQALQVLEEMTHDFATGTSGAADQSDLRTFLALILLLGEMGWRIYTDHATTTSIDMRSFLDALPGMFCDGQQHDASEFFKMLLELLDRSEKQWCRLTAGNDPTITAASSPTEGSLVETWFGGYMETRLQCCVCGDVRTSNSAFWDLSLVVPKTKDTTNTDPTRAAVAAAGLAQNEDAPTWNCLPAVPDDLTRPAFTGAVIPYVPPPTDSILLPGATASSGVEDHALPHTKIHARTTYTGTDMDAAEDAQSVPTPRGTRSSHSSRNNSDTFVFTEEQAGVPPTVDPLASVLHTADSAVLLSDGVHDVPVAFPAMCQDELPPLAVPRPASPVEGTARTTETAASPVDGEVVDGRTVTIQHLLWQTTAPQWNTERLAGDNQLRCPTCEARTDTTLSTVVLAQVSTKEDADDVTTPCPAVNEEEDGDADVALTAADGQASASCGAEMAADTTTTAALGVSAEALPRFLTLQLQRFAFDRVSLSFGKLLQPVAMEEVVLLPVAPRTTISVTPTSTTTPDTAANEESSSEEAVNGEDRTDDGTPLYVPYRLGAILVHSGTTPYSGHYYTLVRHDADSAARCLMTHHEEAAKAKARQMAMDKLATETRAATNTETKTELTAETEPESTTVEAAGAAPASVEAGPVLFDAEKAAREHATILAYAATLAGELEAARARPMGSLPDNEDTTDVAVAAAAATTAAATTVGVPFLSTTLDGVNVTGHATEGWVMVNDSHVMSIEPKRMLDVLLGKRGVYSALETAFVLLYERVMPSLPTSSAQTATPVSPGNSSSSSSSSAPSTARPLPGFSDRVLDLYAQRARLGAAPLSGKVNDVSFGPCADTLSSKPPEAVNQIIWDKGKNTNSYYTDPHDDVAMRRPFAFFDTGTAGF